MSDAVSKRAKGKGTDGATARGYAWPPFEPGHTLSVRHGAYATLYLRPRAEEIATRLRVAMGEAFEDKFTAGVEAAALAAARVEAAMGVLLESAETEDISRLDDRARGWLRLYLSTLEVLGLTPKVESGGRATGPVTLVIATAFPGVRRADVELDEAYALEAEELPALERGDSP